MYAGPYAGTFPSTTHFLHNQENSFSKNYKACLDLQPLSKSVHNAFLLLT